MTFKNLIKYLTSLAIMGVIVTLFLTHGSFGFENQIFENYVNQFDKYSIIYPSDWFIQESRGQGSIVSISNFDPADLSSLLAVKPDKFAIDIVVLNNSKQLSLDEFLIWHDRNNYEGTGIETTVHSVIPITVNGKNGILRDITTIATVWEALIEADNKIYLLAGRKDANFETVFNQILYSLQIQD